jgi:hypothetical protein
VPDRWLRSIPVARLMKTRLVNFLTITSLLLFVASGSAWVRYSLGSSSGWQRVWFTVTPPASGVHQIDFFGGAAGFYQLRCSYSGPSQLIDAHLRSAKSRYDLHWRPRHPAAWGGGLLFLPRVGHDRYPAVEDPAPGVKETIDSRAVVVPLWIPALLAAVPVLLWLRRYFRHHRRTAHGLCPACGYDLRATPDRCPECGLALAASAR